MDQEIKDVLNLIVNKLDTIDVRLDTIYTRLDNMDTRLSHLETRQDESYKIIRALEENSKTTRAEQDKMMFMIADIQGKVNILSNEVEDHEKVISQLRAIK